jgi:hypothetical protein
MRSFIMRMSRSVSLLVKGTAGSRRKCSVSARRTRNRSSRLCPVRRGARPRVLPPHLPRCAPAVVAFREKPGLQRQSRRSVARCTRRGPASAERRVVARDSWRDRRGAAIVASGAPSPPSRFRRAPSIREDDARYTSRAARQSSCSTISSDRARQCRQGSVIRQQRLNQRDQFFTGRNIWRFSVHPILESETASRVLENLL